MCYSEQQTQKRRQAGDKAAMELKGGRSEKSDATAGAVYAVVDKKSYKIIRRTRIIL